jgi:hypothetical protein
MRQVSETGEDGNRRYRRKVAFAPRDRQEWIAVPVPAFLPRGLVETARAMIEMPRPQERKNLTRGWELRGVMRCGCGAAMTTHTARRGEKRYHYYRCYRSADYRRDSCRQRMVRVEDVEQEVWGFVSGLLKDPEKVRAGVEALIEEEKAVRPHGPSKGTGAWTQKLEECERLRRAYQDQQAAGLTTLEELGERLEDIENTRRLAQAELMAAADREERARELEVDRDALMERWTGMVPDALEALTPEERNEMHRMLRLQVTPVTEGYAVSGVLCTPEPSSFSRSRITAPTPPRRHSSSTASSRR